jgi:hypothetical protein
MVWGTLVLRPCAVVGFAGRRASVAWIAAVKGRKDIGDALGGRGWG